MFYKLLKAVNSISPNRRRVSNAIDGVNQLLEESKNTFLESVDYEMDVCDESSHHVLSSAYIDKLLSSFDTVVNTLIKNCKAKGWAVRYQERIALTFGDYFIACFNPENIKDTFVVKDYLTDETKEVHYLTLSDLSLLRLGLADCITDKALVVFTLDVQHH